jgi:hypothetical protein
MSVTPKVPLLLAGAAVAVAAGIGAATGLAGAYPGGAYPSPGTATMPPAATTPPAQTATALKISATLTPGQETPKPVGGKGSGTFTASLKGTKLTYTLSYKGLTGKAVAAHLHRGKPGTSGPVVVPLCGPPACTSPLKGTKTISKSFISAMRTGNAYVNVHTAKNPGGEVRGKIKVSSSS